MKRKPQPGRCGICGQAVTQLCHVNAARKVWGCYSGHYYRAGELEKVRCYLHMEPGDPRTPQATFGGMPMVN